MDMPDAMDTVLGTGYWVLGTEVSVGCQTDTED